jgi:hypothetical protein
MLCWYGIHSGKPMLRGGQEVGACQRAYSLDGGKALECLRIGGPGGIVSGAWVAGSCGGTGQQQVMMTARALRVLCGRVWWLRS